MSKVRGLAMLRRIAVFVILKLLLRAYFAFSNLSTHKTGNTNIAAALDRIFCFGEPTARVYPNHVAFGIIADNATQFFNPMQTAASILTYLP